jgi:hypothetical protein
MLSIKTSRPEGIVYVRFGSKADMCSAIGHVRFTPNSDAECVHSNVRLEPRRSTESSARPHPSLDQGRFEVQRGRAGDPNRARRRGRGVVQPPVLDAAFQPIAVVPRRLLRLGEHHEAGWIFRDGRHCPAVQMIR